MRELLFRRWLTGISLSASGSQRNTTILVAMKSKPNYRDIFCQRLKQARLAKGLSQKQLGIEAGIDEFVASTRINRYEKGVHEANTETIQQLSEVLNVPLAYFYTADDTLAELILAFQSLSSEDKPEIVALVKSRAERPGQG